MTVLAPEKFIASVEKTLYAFLSPENQKWIKQLNALYPFTFQEIRLLCEMARDLEMWEEKSIEVYWNELENRLPGFSDPKQRKDRLFGQLRALVRAQKERPKSYTQKIPLSRKESLHIVTEETGKKIFGDCPVASEKTVCCNLKTIDAVENCAFGCSYCTIQTFYGDRIAFDKNFKEKLNQIELDPNRFYHVGTGQSSDSLIWGNREGILDHLCEFARKHPNILLEFKTKSDNVSYFLDHEVPKNIVISWSLNPDVMIQNEEHFTASLDRRFKAAKKVRDRGVKVAFHFHPIVYYEGWKQAYPELAERVQTMFRPEEILFISFGSVTLIKPVIQEIRKRGGATKILQMEMVPDPHGKLTYPDSVKLELFQTMFDAFQGWHGKVFFYLCMERAYFWDQVFGWHYPTNEEFERDFGLKTMAKIQ